MMKNIFFIVITFLISTNAFCNPHDTIPVPAVEVAVPKIYHVYRPLALSIIGAGLVSDYYAIPRIKAKKNISDAEIKALNPDLLTPFDRWALHQNPDQQKLFRNMSDIGLAPYVLLPAFFLFDKKIKKDWFDLLLMYAEGHTFTFSFYNYSALGPTYQNRYRPMTYYTNFSLKERESGNNRNSFYSGHTATTAFTSFWMAKIYFDYHPEIKLKKYILYGIALVPAIGMSYFRIRSLDHFPSDNLVGLVLGATLGVVVPDLHKIHPKTVSVGMFTSPYGNGLTVRWLITNKQERMKAISEEVIKKIEKEKI